MAHENVQFILTIISETVALLGTISTCGYWLLKMVIRDIVTHTIQLLREDLIKEFVPRGDFDALRRRLGEI